MTITGVEHAVSAIGKAAWKVKKKRIMEGISMKYRPDKTFDKADKEVTKKLKEPQRSDYPKGVAGNIKYKVAMREYLEKIS